MFVTFEGIEGAGKSTLMARVAERLECAGEAVTATREPGGTPFGDSVRSIFLDPSAVIGPIAEAMLMNASRAQLCTDVIRPSLRAGRTVLCDRFFDATLAYQGFGRELDVEGLFNVCLAATGGLSPDLTLLIDISSALSHERVASRARSGSAGIDRVERESGAFHERVRAGYLELAARFSRIVVLDGTQSSAALEDAAMVAIEHVRARVRSIVP